MKEKRILIVDDEEELCEILQYNLSNEGYITEIAHSAEEALKRSPDKYDLILLDVMMGAMSGFKFADKIIKDLNINVPIIFLTAKNTENDILTGFSLGAVDYIPKPFSIYELIARVNAVLKRSFTADIDNNSPMPLKEFNLDTSRKRLILNDEYVNLAKKEYELIKLLFENQGKVFSREDLITRIWDKDNVATKRIVDVNVARLRNKLGQFSYALRSKSGYGYYIEF